MNAITPGRENDYQPRTPERLIEILRALSEQPRSWQREAANTIEHLLLRLAAKPADDVREATIEECAKIAEENASITADGEGEIWIAKKIASCIRALSTAGEPSRVDTEPRCDCGHLFEICNHPNCDNAT